MTRRLLPFALTYAIGVLAAAPAGAANMSWLKDTPAEQFTEEDWRLLRQTIDQALEHSSKGERLSWNNPDSGNSGSVSNIGPSEVDGRPCVRLGIHNETARLSGDSVARFCRQADGSWKMEGR